MTVEELFVLVAKGLGVSGILTFILVPVVKYWLGKLYVTTIDFKAHVERTKEYSDECEARADERHRQIKERLAELGNAIQIAQNKLEAEVRKNSDRLTSQETKVQVFWNMIEKSTADLLHRDDTPDIDRLLEKLPAENLEPEEREELVQSLTEIESSKKEPQSRRVAAALLLASIVARYPSK